MNTGNGGEPRPWKRLKIVEPLIVSLVVWGIYCCLRPAIICDHGRAREGTAHHLISQLDQALESYATDYAVYPPGGGSGSREGVECLSRVGPKKQKYFEFPQDLLNDGHVVNPVNFEKIYYRCPGRFRPTRFDLWAEDRNGNPFGINNW